MSSILEDTINGQRHMHYFSLTPGFEGVSLTFTASNQFSPRISRAYLKHNENRSRATAEVTLNIATVPWMQ